MKYRSSPLLQNLSLRHWKLGIYYQKTFCAYLCFIFPGASAVGHCQKQESGQSRLLVICLWLFLRLWLRTLLPHYKHPNLLFPSLCCSRVPWLLLGASSGAHHLPYGKYSFSPWKGRRESIGIYPSIYSWNVVVFLHCCVPKRRSEDVKSMKWLWNWKTAKQTPLWAQESHPGISSWEWHVLVLPNIPNDAICPQTSVNAGFCSEWC